MTKSESKTLGAVFLIAGTAVGAGMLAIPIATGASGLSASLLLLMGVFAYMLLTLFLFLEAMYYCPNPSTNLIGLCRKLSGPFSETLAWLLFLSLLYVASASYMIGSGEILSSSITQLATHKLASTLIFSLFFGGIAFFKMKWVDRINRFLVFGLLMAFAGLIITSLPHIKATSLTSGKPLLAITAIPVVVTSFTSHIILPSIRTYLDNHLPDLKRAILLGCGIPLLFYSLWSFVILGLLPSTGDYSLMSILTSSNDHLSLLIEYLDHHYHLSYFSEIVGWFSFFAISTSFWGVMISLRDFIEDGLNLEQYQYHTLYAVALAFIPPLLMALILPTGFSTFLHYAGIIILLLYGVLPIYLVARARYVLNLKSAYTLPGGKPLLIIASLLTLFMLFSTALYSL